MLKDTIISAFNYDGTLLKWLKKVEDALQNASASEFRVNKKGNATISFSIVFANGDTLESGDIILQQGESVTGATIRQGHLILTLSNGNELDAGDLGAVTGFSINESQHLIVTYQNGTTQDLGAIFNGDININGSITANTIDTNDVQGFVGNKTSPLNEDFVLNVLDLSNISSDLIVKVKYAHKRISNGKLNIVIQLALENNGNSPINVPASTPLLATDQLILLPAGVTSLLFGAGPAPSFSGVLDTMAGTKSTSYTISNGYFYGSGAIVELARGNLNKYGAALMLENSPILASAVTLEAGKGITWRKEFNFTL